MDATIEIHETFLSYVWGLSYASFVLFDEEINGPHTGKRPEHGKSLGYFSSRAYAVFNHAMALRRDFREWPPHLPNPETFGEEDRHYIEKTNGIFLAAIDFILCHEVAHVSCGHLRTKRQAQSRGHFITSLEEKEFEWEADNWAIARVKRGIRSADRNTTVVGYGAIVGLGGLLFLNRNLTSRSHPDKNDRITNVLSMLSLPDLHNLWGIAATFYLLWDHAFQVGLNFPRDFASYKELVQWTNHQLQPLKLGEEEDRVGLD